jgi:hypothetical protein
MVFVTEINSYLKWESYIVRGAADALALTQAALIGQTFGMLSGVLSSL